MTPPVPVLSDEGLDAVHQVDAYDQCGHRHQIHIAREEPITIKVDGKELVTLMTLGSHPELMVLGYLRNLGLFEHIADIQSVLVDWDREIADVKTVKGTGVSATQPGPDPITTNDHLTHGLIAKLRQNPLPAVQLRQSHLYDLLREVKKHNHTYRHAGSVHGCGLCHNRTVIQFIEDVGRHGATDAISGYMWLNAITGRDKIFYTTGRLTSEIVMKVAMMGISAIISRNGSTLMGFELAQQFGVTLISRAKGRHFVALNGRNLIFDVEPGSR